MSVNRVHLIGRLGQNPEIRTTESGNTVANFSVATSEKWKDKNGNKQEDTEWHRIVIWGKLAEVVEKYVKKGDMLYLEGKLKTRTWEKDGVTRYATEIHAYSMQMLGGKNETSALQETGGSNSAEQDDLPF